MSPKKTVHTTRGLNVHSDCVTLLLIFDTKAAFIQKEPLNILLLQQQSKSGDSDHTVLWKQSNLRLQLMII